ncbi:GNAT family N-acetyltransferase [Sphaerimonospora mesophila]|uniref:GNAT family N-acetyltransferase n=1 Tax=Sphaerimonospora mesophila TaxID=37483 RepID=UPI0006E380AA
MFPQEVISAGPVVLRLPVEADADAVTRACSDPAIARFIPLVPSPYTPNDALEWITVVTPDTWKAGGANFVIADRVTGEMLGVIGLQPADRYGNGEVGYWLAPRARGRGAATTALRALADWAFAHGLSRMTLRADVENVASQLVARRAGFALEGVQRGAQARRDGSRADLAAYARLATDSGEPITPLLPFLPGGHPGGALTDGVVRLTPLAAADADDWHALTNVPDVVRYRVPPQPIERAEARERCRYAGHRWLAGQQADMVIRDAETGAFAGDIQLANIIPPLGQAMVGYSLHPGFRGRGLVTRAVRLLVEWAFADTSLGRIVAGTDPGNTASHRVLERAGFTREHLAKGLLPGPDGTRVDDLQWVRLRP